jgi:hypothetical protein
MAVSNPLSVFSYVNFSGLPGVPHRFKNSKSDFLSLGSIFFLFGRQKWRVWGRQAYSGPTGLRLTTFSSPNSSFLTTLQLESISVLFSTFVPSLYFGHSSLVVTFSLFPLQLWSFLDQDHEKSNRKAELLSLRANRKLTKSGTPKHIFLIRQNPPK